MERHSAGRRAEPAGLVSYDNTGHLGASTWRHVAFIEQTSERIEQARESGRRLVDLGMPVVRPSVPASPQPEGIGPSPAAPGMDSAELGSFPPVRGGAVPASGLDGDYEAAVATAATAAATGTIPDFRWLMASDVCKHCTHAGCLDVCPTGALFRTEFGRPWSCNPMSATAAATAAACRSGSSTGARATAR